MGKAVASGPVGTQWARHALSVVHTFFVRASDTKAKQLLTRNVSEAIVDKDNHALDAMKYAVMSQPSPTQKPLERRVIEHVQEVRTKAIEQGATPDQAATTSMVQYSRIVHEEAVVDEQPRFYDGNARRRLAIIQRQLWRRGRQGR